MECFHLEQSYTSSVTVGQMYSCIKTMGQLSEKDRKWNALSLHLLLNELVCCIKFNITSQILRHFMARLIMMKTVLMTSSSWSLLRNHMLIPKLQQVLNNQNGGLNQLAHALVCNSICFILGAVEPTSWFHVLIDTAGSPVKWYKSAYRPQISSAWIEYEAFEFVRQDCIVDGDGNISLIKHNETETVLVAKHWQKHISGGVQHGGYIAIGLSKFAFKVAFLLYCCIVSHTETDIDDTIGFLPSGWLCHFSMQTNFFMRAIKCWGSHSGAPSSSPCWLLPCILLSAGKSTLHELA